METRRNETLARARSLIWVAWLAAALVAGCGGGAEVVLLVPFFTVGFTGTVADTNGTDHNISMNLNPNEPTTPSGNFESGSTLRIDNDTQIVTGSYSGCTMSIVLAPTPPATTVPTPLATSYNGRFTGPDTIELSPKSGTLPTLTLTRGFGQKDTRSQTC